MAQSNQIDSDITVANTGKVWGTDIGISAVITTENVNNSNSSSVDQTPGGTTNVTQEIDTTGSILIGNSGAIGADSLFAIETQGAETMILNMSGGVITGFVSLTDFNDLYDNQAGGTFEARLSSNFGDGFDLFRNAEGATVHTANDAGMAETTIFDNLEQFDNMGLISLLDGHEDDIFRIVGTGLSYNASSYSTLAVDTFLGGPGSTSDQFVIIGDVTGETKVQVYNTNPLSGGLGAVIPVVTVEGNVSPDAFFLPQPVNGGVFAYDLYFRETNSGVFELKSFPGANAHILPQLVTAAQDIWHQGSSTWFDRTDDLRVWLNSGGAMPAMGFKDLSLAAPTSGNPTPAAWVRGAGSWLERDASATTKAFGRTYNFDLEGDLETVDFQFGLDFGSQGVMRSDDMLVFGFLGGLFHSTLDYDNVGSSFDYDGFQVGAYATYLNGGLFVDTLLNVHLYDLDDKGALRPPSELDGTTVGVRSDAGYRFGGFNGGAFIEPLATIEAIWSDIDGFTSGPTSISFDDDANVRGRLGLRAGTSRAAWEGATVETFVIGSLWGNLSGDNQATVTSNGTTFKFEDNPDDVWAEVSLGVNLADPGRKASMFGKVDVTFGDDVTGVGGKAGIRIGW